ncbi:MAG: GxxExxY protein [Gemmatimonadetes bacterium]|nr:GxxExxY protein [Gemmatimonadota bacterium]
MADRDLTEEALTKAVIGAFYEVYNNLGYGFFEHIYVLALEMELIARGLKVQRELWVPVLYKTVRVGYQRTDMLVEDRLVVEAKSTEKLPESASRKLFNYLHATKLEIGLLLHFGPKARFYPVVYRH